MSARLVSSSPATAASADRAHSRRLWIDIDDLVDYLGHHSRPSGIQRVILEFSRAFDALAPENVGFVVRGRDQTDLRVLGWPQLYDLFNRAMLRELAVAVTDPLPAQADDPGSAAHNECVPAEDDASDDMPKTDLNAVIETMLSAPGAADEGFLRAQGAVFREIGRFPVSLGRYGGRAIRQRFASMMRRGVVVDAASETNTPHTHDIVAETAADAPVPAPPAGLRAELQPGDAFADVAKPGDVFLALGAPWHNAGYAGMIRRLRDDLRLSFALLMYDIVPVRHPEWCNLGMVNAYTAWHDAVLPLVDTLFAISRATAADVTRYLAERDIGCAGGVRTIALGTNFSLAERETSARSERLIDEPYVLCVSTIEARKNHILLFRVWRRLLSEMSPIDLPTLVFAGSEGWLVADLMRQLDNTDWLGGKIRFVRNPTDPDLRRLYADCLFTIFPSFFEGWGLPVTESLSQGKPCVASGTTSIPEAGGRLAQYFNPYDAHDAYRVVRGVISDPEGLHRWTAEIRAAFTPVPWEVGAATILEALDVRTSGFSQPLSH